MSLTEYGLVTKVSISSCLRESEKLFQECALCTSGIFFQKLRKMEKHAYLNMIYNKNDTERCKKLTFLLMMAQPCFAAPVPAACQHLIDHSPKCHASVSDGRHVALSPVGRYHSLHKDRRPALPGSWHLSL
jgi:hypothetical protein